MAEIVCFIESRAESETPLEMTELSSGSIRLSMLAMTEKPRSSEDLRVETKSSETPPPRQLTVAAEEEAGAPRRGATDKRRRGRSGSGGGGCCFVERSARRRRTKEARAEVAM